MLPHFTLFPYCVDTEAPYNVSVIYRSRGPGSNPELSIFWVVGLERGPFSLVSTTENLLKRKSSGSGLENREYGRRDSSRWPRGTLFLQNLALASTTNCGRSVGIIISRTRTTVILSPYYVGGNIRV
jgi:hypothetical protein